MKKHITLAVALGTLGLSVSAVGALNNQLRGSDTLELWTDRMLEICANVGTLDYVGGGSTVGEWDMVLKRQELSPMSRALNKDRACRADDPREVEGRVVALDGLAVVGNSAQCAGDSIAYTSSVCFDVTDRNATAGIDCPDCNAGTSTYCIADEKDALRLIFAGMTKTAGSTASKKACDSDVRHSLAAQWTKLFEGACSGTTCTELKHAWRRDDLSGTTDTFLSLLNLPAITSTPFCNGTTVDDLDPVRRTCDASDSVCEFDGKVGLVVPIASPQMANADEGKQYPSAACATGKFSLKPALKVTLTGGSFRYDCPERQGFNIAGLCLAPQTTDGKFDCLNSKSNNNVFTAGKDGRAFNRFVRDATGAILLDRKGTPQTSSWYRMRQGACNDSSATVVIGCLAQNYACSIGFAGLEAAGSLTGAQALKVKGIEATPTNVRKLITAPGTQYPFSRFLYVNSLVGFENIVNAEEKAFGICSEDSAQVDDAVDAAKFITLGQAPFCQDFNEATNCNGNTYTCDTDADCGVFGPCLGGNTSTTALEGTCQRSQACTTNADCSWQPGRTCVNNRCDFTSNTNACL